MLNDKRIPVLLLVILLAGVTWGHEPAAPLNDSLQGRTPEAPSSDGNNPSSVAAAPIQGVTGKGSAFVLYRSETGLVREFTMILPAGKGDRG